MTAISAVFDLAAEIIQKVSALLRSTYVAPNVSIWSIMIVFILIGITISLFVRTGGAG